MYSNLIDFIRKEFNSTEFIPLHEPRFVGNEKKYLNEAIDSTFVSSVGVFVDKFEEMMKDLTGAKYAIATVNGTAALHIALKLAGSDADTEVITQPLSFIATCNAINYTGAKPIFVDVDLDTMGMSAKSLEQFLENNSYQKDGKCFNANTHKQIVACVPMHTFGFPCRIDLIADICNKYHINLVEDAAESLGSYYKEKHTGTFGLLGTFSFNGNKTVTCGGGGAIVTNDPELAKRAKHITTTAKIPHKWEYVHDEIGYNYRMPNLNAALACAQLEQLKGFIENKRELSDKYELFFKNTDIEYKTEIPGTKANYWLMTVLLKDSIERDNFLEATNSNKVMTRPIWKLMNKLVMFQDCQKTELTNSEWLEERVVNIPSSVRINK
jgi:perosamine synthetase